MHSSMPSARFNSHEFDDLGQCDRFAVFRDGGITGTLEAPGISEEAVLHLSFAEAA